MEKTPEVSSKSKKGAAASKVHDKSKERRCTVLPEKKRGGNLLCTFKEMKGPVDIENAKEEALPPLEVTVVPARTSEDLKHHKSDCMYARMCQVENGLVTDKEVRKELNVAYYSVVRQENARLSKYRSTKQARGRSKKALEQGPVRDYLDEQRLTIQAEKQAALASCTCPEARIPLQEEDAPVSTGGAIVEPDEEKENDNVDEVPELTDEAVAEFVEILTVTCRFVRVVKKKK